MISGAVTDFEGRPIEGAQILLKDDRFRDAASTHSDAAGRYVLNPPKGRYTALLAVKDYQTKHLEYWAWNVPADRDLEVNPRFDRLELYGVQAWRPPGAYPSVQIYFRPMSLTRVKKAVEEAGGMDAFQNQRLNGHRARTRSGEHRCLHRRPNDERARAEQGP